MSESVTRRDFMRAAGAGVALSAAGRLFGDEPTRRRPNVLVIMTDQQPLSAMGAYGNARIRTPNMDRIAGGVRFDNYYLSAFPCSPSRASLFSGRYPHSHGVMTNDVLFDPAVPCLGDIFKAEGYDTAYFGKWHLGGNMYRGIRRKKRGWFDSNWFYKTVPDPARGFRCEPVEGGLGEDAPQHGFDHWVGGWKHYKQYLRDAGLGEIVDKNPSVGNHNDLPDKPEGQHMASRLPQEHHMAAFFGKEAGKWLRAPERKQKPFCAVVSFFGPHLPVAPPKPWDTMCPAAEIPLPANLKDPLKDKPFRQANNRRCYKGRSWSDDQFRDYIARYWGYTSYIDAQMGRVLRALDETGLADDTIVVFTTDHGDMVGGHGFIFKMGAGYEELMHVPLAIRYDRGLPKGATVNRTVETVDVLPTILDLAGVKPPAGLQGASALALAKGQAGTWDDTSICEMSGCAMLKQGPWKFTFNWHPRDLDELYNVADDPLELTNLAGRPEHAARVKAMQDQILQWADANKHRYADVLRKARDKNMDLVDVRPEIRSLQYKGDRKLEIELAWRVNDALPKDMPFWTFVHFVHPDSPTRDKIHFRLTRWPKTPTTEWPAGSVYPMGPFTIRIPKDAPSGEYTVRVGLFNPKKRKSPRLRCARGRNAREMGVFTLRVKDGQVVKAVFKPGP